MDYNPRLAWNMSFLPCYPSFWHTFWQQEVIPRVWVTLSSTWFLHKNSPIFDMYSPSEATQTIQESYHVCVVLSFWDINSNAYSVCRFDRGIFYHQALQVDDKLWQLGDWGCWFHNRIQGTDGIFTYIDPVEINHSWRWIFSSPMDPMGNCLYGEWSKHTNVNWLGWVLRSPAGGVTEGKGWFGMCLMTLWCSCLLESRWNLDYSWKIQKGI